ncbi:MAG: hemolysin III family protein [Spirochaetaceae bacterium]|nr:hemolysin III family protein [Myxococcales bacterium]MCB9724866.1 hemolysin III family protein [Spirochaetaceae bacterium]HPG25912.1 hemolysin III family protein [Myxococcota bacterium]
MANEAAARALGRTIANPVRLGIDALGAALSVAASVSLLGRSAGGGPGAMLLLPLSQLALYVVSGLYHGLSWSPVAKRRWQRADHAMIYLKIAGAATGFAVLTEADPSSHPLVRLVWLVGAVGVAQKVWLPDVEPKLSSHVQLAQALLILPILLELLASRGGAAASEGVALLAASIGLYLAGFVVFMTERPRLWPGVFDFHDFFHVLLVTASLSVYGFVAGQLPA